MTPNVYLQFRDGLTYQPKQVNPDLVTQIAWDYQEQGGLAQIAATLAVSWETTGIAAGDYMEAWVLGETVPRARGIVSTPERHLDLKETQTLIAFGRMADMDKTLDYKVIFHPSGSPQDLSYYAAELLSDYQKRKAVGSAFAPVLDIDVQVTGSNLESLTLAPGSVRSGMDQLYAQAGGNVVWGWDVHPVTGNDRFYLRPRTYAVGAQFFVGQNVKLLTSPSELVPVTNAVYLKGGPAKYPNLITNASFEQPTNPSSDSGSLLLNGGFELPSNSTSTGGDTSIQSWTGSGSITRNTHDASTNHNASPHSGQWYLLLDSTGKSASQEVTVSQNTPYVATIFARAENGLHLPAGLMTITGRDASDNVTETPVGGVLALAPQSATWTGGAASSVVGSDSLQTSVVFTNPSTVKARVSLTCTSSAGAGFGLCLDDVTFGPAGAVGQYGWSTHLQNPGSAANAFNWILWACKAAAWDGAYGVRASVTANFANKPVIAVAGNDNSGDSRFHFAPGSQQSLVCGFFVRMTPGMNSAAGAVRAEYREWAGDGHETQHVYNPGDPWSTTNVPNDGQWHLVTVSISAHGDAASATIQAAFGASGVYDIDGFFARDAAAVVTAAQEPQAANYLRGADFERYVTAEAVCTSGSAADVAAAASYSTWSRREAALTNDQIVDWTADAQSYLQAWFQRSAVLLSRPRVELTGQFAPIPLPGDGTQIAVSGTGADIPAQWCSHAAFVFRQASLDVTLDLSNERPTWAKLLKAAQASGGSASSSFGAGAGSSVGAPSGAGQTGASTPAQQLAPTGVTAGTYTNATVQVNANGQVVSASSGAAPAVTAPVPLWRGRGYAGGISGTATHLDHTYFDGANLPSGKTVRKWTQAGWPGGSLFLQTTIPLVQWLRLGLTNPTGAAITAGWWVPTLDNGLRIVWNGTDLVNKATADSPGYDLAGTFSVAAGQSALLEVFWYNADDGNYSDSTNPGILALYLDALDQAGMTFYDAGA